MTLASGASSTDAPIQGPLGLWPWPLLNTIIHVTRSQPTPTPRTPSPGGGEEERGNVLENEETVTWTDWRGEERTIRITREVH